MTLLLHKIDKVAFLSTRFLFLISLSLGPYFLTPSFIHYFLLMQNIQKATNLIWEGANSSGIITEALLADALLTTGFFKMVCTAGE